MVYVDSERWIAWPAALYSDTQHGLFFAGGDVGAGGALWDAGGQGAHPRAALQEDDQTEDV